MAQCEVERVVGRRVIGSTVEYLVQWRGFPDAAATWEPFAKGDGDFAHVVAFEQQSAPVSLLDANLLHNHGMPPDRRVSS